MNLVIYGRKWLFGSTVHSCHFTWSLWRRNICIMIAVELQNLGMHFLETEDIVSCCHLLIVGNPVILGPIFLYPVCHDCQRRIPRISLTGQLSAVRHWICQSTNPIKWTQSFCWRNFVSVLQHIYAPLKFQHRALPQIFKKAFNTEIR